jgi:hypothetical protein
LSNLVGLAVSVDHVKPLGMEFRDLAVTGFYPAVKIQGQLVDSRFGEIARFAPIPVMSPRESRFDIERDTKRQVGR